MESLKVAFLSVLVIVFGADACSKQAKILRCDAIVSRAFLTPRNIAETIKPIARNHLRINPYEINADNILTKIEIGQTYAQMNISISELSLRKTVAEALKNKEIVTEYTQETHDALQNLLCIFMDGERLSWEYDVQVYDGEEPETSLILQITFKHDEVAS